ncbi:hypothetical protein [Mycetocola saprophilus]|uniref:hypothetical protein n=1 Tax=Mycetocola saprophilus TaxID=76636 RepID=UPI0004BFD2C2|nr:hypothetical protein [Mycetocola saprophilus]
MKNQMAAYWEAALTASLPVLVRPRAQTEARRHEAAYKAARMVPLQVLEAVNEATQLGADADELITAVNAAARAAQMRWSGRGVHGTDVKL